MFSVINSTTTFLSFLLCNKCLLFFIFMFLYSGSFIASCLFFFFNFLVFYISHGIERYYSITNTLNWIVKVFWTIFGHGILIKSSNDFSKTTFFHFSILITPTINLIILNNHCHYPYYHLKKFLLLSCNFPPFRNWVDFFINNQVMTFKKK